VLIELAIVVVLILVNGILSGAEIAIVSVRRTRIHALVEEHRAGARALEKLRAQPERFLATVQIGITVVSTTAGAFGGASVAAHLEPLLRLHPVIGPYAHDVALVAVVVVISYLSLVLGELVPKSLALRAAEPYALLMSRVLLALSWFARPLVWLLTSSSNLVLKPFADRTTFTEARLSKEELQELVEEAAQTGALDERTTELTSRALEFEELTAADVMIPRNQVVALPRRAGSDDVRRCFMEERRSRVPVYEGTLDNMIGYVTAKDLLPVAWEGGLIVIDDILRPLKVFTETTPASQILQFMQQERRAIAMVIDEHGAVAGVVTFEDLIEEVVGEFFSEHDRRASPVVREPSGTLLVRGDVGIREVNRQLEEPLEEPGGVSTIGGLCGVLAGGIVPPRGARLASRSGAVLVVLDASIRVVRKVRVVPPPPRPGMETPP
jgi:putative hemolysin